ncbi:MAG: 50S ribosomal protein L29 [Bacteroidota bacterium]
MKARKAKDLRQLSQEEMLRSLTEAEETLSKLHFQHALSQLQDVAYIRILRKDIARMKTLLHEQELS